MASVSDRYFGPANRRPGDLLLDRYFPDADEETRERAREAFAEFARAMEELADEMLAAQAADSRDLSEWSRIRPTSQP